MLAGLHIHTSLSHFFGAVRAHNEDRIRSDLAAQVEEEIA